MRRPAIGWSLAAFAVVGCLAGCAREAPAGPKVTRIEPGAGAQKAALEAMIKASPGDTIEFAAGRFVFDSTLSLDVAGVTVRGQGIEQTQLDWKEQAPGTGGEGLMVTADNFTLEDLTVLNTKADAVKVEGTSGVTFRRVFVNWEGEPRTENGAYGLYPVQCSNVLIEDSRVRGASDAGIYVGQSRNIIVRRNEAYENVAGIEIENSFSADVYENKAYHNSGGLLVFSLPEMPVKNGRDTRVYDNQVYDNNHPNFGLPGNIIATLPPGSGVILMANDNTEVFRNSIRNNQTANLSITSFTSTGREYDDPQYDPIPEGIWVHDNVFEGGGENPTGRIADAYAEILGRPFPDIVYDGVIDIAKLENGVLPAAARVYIENNGDATFVNLDMPAVLAGGKPRTSSDLLAYAGSLPTPPPPVALELPAAAGAGGP